MTKKLSNELEILLSKTTINTDKGNMKKDKNTTKEEWQAILSPEEYYVLREKGTERPFTGKYDSFYEEGQYTCSGCGQKLFSSSNKYNSHCGWPAFDQAIEGSVEYIRDLSHGMVRVEVVCSNCHGHLGHVFPDGPEETTGQRYCINSISIQHNK